MLKITAVSYLNTLPFIYGIKKSGILTNFNLSLEPPSMCAQHMLEGKADIALVPIGAIPTLKNINIITDYCIGANGIVQSVLLLSQKPLHEISTIYLDMQSRTSVALTKVLAKEYWNIDIQTQPLNISEITIHSIPETMVCIGDKTFEWQNHFAYSYDLAAEWQKMTGLPFVFACWVCTANTSEDIILKFNSALKYGIEHKQEAINEFLVQHTPPFDLEDYLTNAISYRFDDKKREAMNIFLGFLNTPM